MKTIPATNSIAAPNQSSGPSAPSTFGCICSAACRARGMDSQIAMTPRGMNVANISFQLRK